MLVKEKVLEVVASLPNEFSIDQLVERLVVLQKIETGLSQVSEGKVVNSEKAREHLFNNS